MCSSLRGPAVGLLLALAAAARADLIFLKDGFVIQGKVHRESTSMLDPHSKETITIPKGFFYVDDGARRFYFSPRQVQDVDKDFQVAEDNVTTGRFISIVGPQRQPVILDIAEADVQVAWQS